MNRRDFFKFGAAAAAAAAVGRTVRAAEMPGFGPGAPAPQNNQIWLMTSAFPGESFEDGTEFYIWISDDRNKIPIFFESPIRVGSVRAYISGFDGLRFPLESLEE